MSTGICKRPVLRHYKNAVELVDDTLAQEHCLAIIHQGQEYARTMCTPGLDRELVLGRLFCDGHLNSVEQLTSLRFEPRRKGLMHAYVDIAAHAEAHAPCRGMQDFFLEADQIFALMQQMETTQAVFQRTGATHCSALFDGKGSMLAMAEDIGRHNALDKVIGAALLQGNLHEACAATMSSRLSCELVEKAATVGLTFLCGISVATSLAVDLAAENNITLVGRVRGRRMNVYTRKDRVLWPHKSKREPQACSSAS